MRFLVVLILSLLSVVLAASSHSLKSSTAHLSKKQLTSKVEKEIQSYYSTLVAQAFLDLEASICLDVSANLELKLTGLIDLDLSAHLPEIKLKAEAAVNASVAADLNLLLKQDILKGFNEDISKSISDVCTPNNPTCIRSNSVNITHSISDTFAAKVKNGVLSIQEKLKAHIRIRIKEAVDESINLLIEQIEIIGDVRICSDIDLDVAAFVKVYQQKYNGNPDKLAGKINGILKLSK